MTHRWLPWVALGGIAAALGAALLVIEGPDAMRDRRIDEQRAQALESLAEEVARFRAETLRWPDTGFMTSAIDREAPGLAAADWSFEPVNGEALICLALRRGEVRTPRYPHRPLYLRGVRITHETAGPGRLCRRITDPRKSGGHQ